MKRIAVDFDGTLFTDEYPKIGKPKWRVINWCKERKEKGDVLILKILNTRSRRRTSCGTERRKGMKAALMSIFHPVAGNGHGSLE